MSPIRALPRFGRAVSGAAATATLLCALAGLAPAASAQQSRATTKPPASATQPQPLRSLPTFQPDRAPSEEMQSIWAKLCGETTDPKAKDQKVKVCTTQFEVLNKDAQPILGGAVTKVEGQPNELFSVTVPQGPRGIAIRPGVRVKIDGNEAIALQYSFCFVHGCMAEMTATKELIESLKKGRTVVIGLFDTAGNVLSLPVPLQGFEVAYKGPSVDPKKYVEMRAKMIEDYRRQSGAAPEAASVTGSTVPKAPAKR